MNREEQYTSTANKLLSELNRLKQIKKYNIYRPINLQLAPTELCNLNCEFCSVKKRERRTLPFNDIKKAISSFMRVGPLKSIEITGGGDPTLYPEINELIEYCYHKELSIGLITNGIELNRIDNYTLDRLTWLRISMNGLDYGKEPIIPQNLKGTLGFSYVWNKKSTVDILLRIYGIAKDNNVKYVRIVPDCLEHSEQEKLRTEVKMKIKALGLENLMFVQTKGYDIYSPCLIGGLKPFLYTDGYIYQCSAVALYNRAFNKKWRICHYKDIEKIWPDNYKALPNKMCRAGKCFYFEHNKILDDISRGVEHNGFI